jgi:hypothetical protein
MKPISQTCSACLGEGTIRGATCPYCDGTGSTPPYQADPTKQPPPLPDNLDMPAFPAFGNNKGMSLRDYFAATILGPVYLDHCGVTDHEDVLDYEAIARDAYAMADAMLKERNKC